MPNPRPDRARSLPAVSAAACWLLPLATLAFQLATYRGYGFFRDELYYLASAEHLGFGYVDHPPLIGLVAWLVRSTLGDSLFAVRLLPAVAHGAAVTLTARLAREMGGGRYAQILAALAAALAPIYLGLCGFLSMNAFDLVFWAALWFIVARALRTGDPRLWLLFGMVTGAGLQNKISVLFIGFGVVAGLVAARRWRVFGSWHIWAGGAAACVIFLPHLLWQWHYGWPTLEFMANATREKNVAMPAAAFMAEQVTYMNPLALPLWTAGLGALLLLPRLRAFRPMGWAYVAVLAVMLSTAAKPYYLAPAYMALLAAGAAAFDALPRSSVGTVVRASMLVLVAAGGIVSAPLAKPLLAPEAYLRYVEAIGLAPRSIERHEQARLPQHFADMHGWPELAANVAKVFDALPAADRARACIFAQNYGQAGAIDVLGAPLGLPRAISGHNSYYLWGPRGCTGEVVIALGGDRHGYEEAFASAEQAAVHTCTDCMPYENTLPIYVLRGARMPFAEIWPRVKRFI
jgi:hypothetical protein